MQWESTAGIERKQTACISTQGVKGTCMQEPYIPLTLSHDIYFRRVDIARVHATWESIHADKR
jgi:hypothetical protein